LTKINNRVKIIKRRIFMSTIIDISKPLFETKAFPGDPIPNKNLVKNAPEHGYNLTEISLCVHNGTHIDAPFHFINEGVGVDKLPLDVLYGKCTVKEWDGQIPENCERLIIKGEHIITPSEAELIVKSGVKLVGVELQSVGDPDSPTETHVILLGAGIIPLEGLSLNNVTAGEYTLCAFPLNLGHSDGSPVRAVLITE
jgi:arylformamidase